MNLAFLCLYDMRKWMILLLGSLLLICGLSCEDDLRDNNAPVGIDDPVDDLVRLESIAISETPDGASISSIDITYDRNQLIEGIAFTGGQNPTFKMTYAGNNRLIQIEQSQGAQNSISTLEYEGNTITVNTMLNDGSGQQKELRIDSQNRIDRAIIYTLDNTGNRTETKRLQYIYTQNFNVTRINDLSPNGNTVLGYTEFTYFFNNNAFLDMNDVIRFLIFEDFVPYTRYLPSTQREYERVGGGFVETRAIEYTYSLQEDQFPSSRVVNTTTSTGIQTTYEFFNYQP